MVQKKRLNVYTQRKHVFIAIDQDIFIGLLSYTDKVDFETKGTELSNEIQRNGELDKDIEVKGLRKASISHWRVSVSKLERKIFNTSICDVVEMFVISIVTLISIYPRLIVTVINIFQRKKKKKIDIN